MENGELDVNTPLKAVVVFVGTNNVDCSPEDVFEGILKLLETVKAKLGDVPVVLPVILLFEKFYEVLSVLFLDVVAKRAISESLQG